MKTFGTLALVATMSASALALTASGASAAIACNGQGDCWHVRGPHVIFPHEAGIVVHPDGWRWHNGEHYTWREHEGSPGYWHGGLWIGIP